MFLEASDWGLGRFSLCGFIFRVSGLTPVHKDPNGRESLVDKQRSIASPAPSVP